MLSHDQFTMLAGKMRPQGTKDGGFTVNTTTGHEPTTGYAVSQAGTEESASMGMTHGPRLLDYASRHRLGLSQPGVHLGGWGPGEGEPRHGEAILDNTRVITNRRAATHEMVMENQDAAYHLNGKSYIKNTFKQKPTTFEEPAGFDRGGFERDVADLYRRAHGRPTLAADEAVRQARSNRPHS